MKRRSIVPQKKQSGLCFFRFEAGALSSRIETRAGACRGSAALTANRDLRFDLTLMRARRRVSARSRWERLSSKRRQAGFWTACAAARAVKKGRCGRSYPPAGVLGDPLLSLMSSCFPANRRSDVRRRALLWGFSTACAVAFVFPAGQMPYCKYGEMQTCALNQGQSAHPARPMRRILAPLR